MPLVLLDYPSYFDLLKRPLPDNRDGILEALAADSLIRSDDAGGWSISNLGAILFAKRLEDFRPLRRKAVRVVQYRGTDRIETLREQLGAKGYASGFEGLIGFINGLLPSNEVIGQALRRTVTVFPELAVRELVANALRCAGWAFARNGAAAGTRLSSRQSSISCRRHWLRRRLTVHASCCSHPARSARWTRLIASVQSIYMPVCAMSAESI